MGAERIREILEGRKGQMKACLEACAGCTLCAESCFLFMEKRQDPEYMPAYKVLKTVGLLYRRRGRATPEELGRMQQLLWRNCVLCGRCYCPFGIDLPAMLAFGRTVLRSQGIYGVFPHTSGAPEAERAEAGATSRGA